MTAEREVARLRKALETLQTTKGQLLSAAVEQIPQQLGRLPLESFVVDYGGELSGSGLNIPASKLAPPDAAKSSALPPSSSAGFATPLFNSLRTGEQEGRDTFEAQVRAAGPERLPSPLKRPGKCLSSIIGGSCTPSSSTRGCRSSAARPARLGETVQYTSLNGSPLEGMVLPDGRVLPLQARSHDPLSSSPVEEYDGIVAQTPMAQHLAVALQALSSSSSIHIPSSPDLRKAGRAAARQPHWIRGTGRTQALRSCPAPKQETASSTPPEGCFQIDSHSEDGDPALH